MKTEYLPFYIDGRNAKVLRVDADTLIDDVVKRVKDGQPMWASVHVVATAAAQAFCVDGAKRRQFVRDNEDEIKEAGGNEEAAWEAFCAGKVDELSESLEPTVVEVLEDFIEGDGGEGDEDPDEEDEDEDPEDT